MQNSKGLSVLIALFCFSALTVLSANEIKDGSFENPVVPDAFYRLFLEGTSFNGTWQVVGEAGNVAIVSGDFTQDGFSFPARSGTQSLDLTGTRNTATGVMQIVPTTVGEDYQLRFSIGNVYNPNGPFGTVSTVDVVVNGVRVLTATNDRHSSTMSWKQFSVTLPQMQVRPRLLSLTKTRPTILVTVSTLSRLFQ